MAKKATDWIKHIKRFLKGGDQSTAARKEYAAHYKLNYNSFRTQLSKYLKSDAYKNSLAHQTPELAAKKKRSPQQTDQESAKAGEGETTPARAPVASTVPAVSEDILGRPDGTRTFRRRNRASLTTGKHAKKAFLSKEFADRAKMGSGDLLELLKAQFLLMNDCGVELQNKIKQRYRDGDPLIKYSIDASGKTVETELTEEDAIFDLSIKVGGPMSELMKVISATEEKIENIELKWLDAPAFSREEVAGYTISIIKQRRENKWTAVETCDAFYALGITPPPGIEREKDLELRDAEADVPEGDITPDMAAEARRFMEERKRTEAARMAERRRINEKIYGSNVGVGDENIVERGDSNKPAD